MITVQSSTYPPNYQDTPEAFNNWQQYIDRVLRLGWGGTTPEEEEHPELTCSEG